MRNWVGAAVIAGCLSVVPLARAQFSPPPGSGALPEPVPFATGAATDLNPSCPVPTAGPSDAPGGAPSLSDSSPGAFSEKKFDCENAWFLNIGAQGYERQRLNNGVLATFDPQNLDTGTPPPAGAQVAQRFSNIHAPMNFGVNGTVGYIQGCNTFEFTGFYISQFTRSLTAAKPGQIDLPFFNPPLGFEGDNGLWLQADRTTTTFTSSLGDAEFNYRYANPAIKEAELITGLRYLDLRETLSTYTDDDGAAFPLVNGQPDPTRVATYYVETHNRLLAPQLGFEWAHCVAPWATLGFGGKVALGANFLEQRTSLVRGDGFVGFDKTKNDVQFSQAYELKAFVDFHLMERARLHLGYNAMWLANVADAGDQYNFNLQNINSTANANRTIFFHGPVVELQFLF
jgi:hypothetical protein